ncbi:anaerobic nitric oxide reductase flavorubredoxin [Salmonella enterica subsp. enterica serovar Weltevreden]|nr:anaerobic nitric oxide reductase flavorubredoxin [Salmonella enterica subsp. enterica serovar Weltevreden]
MSILVKNNIHWVGQRDWEVRDFHGTEYKTLRGSSYNSYLIREEKNVLIDTVDHKFSREFVQNLRSEIDLADIDYIIINHAEEDHAGALTELMAQIPDTPIYCTANAIDSINGHHHHPEWNFKVVKTGDTLDIGNGKQLIFVETPMLHWPDSMMTYMTGDAVLFSNDAFGQHYCDERLFNDEVDQTELFEQCQRYYANILTPFSRLVTPKITEILGFNLPVDMIATSHGVVWRDNPTQIVELYLKWAADYQEDRITIFYDTMSNNTRMMADAIAQGINEVDPNVAVKIFNVARSDKNEILTNVFRSKGVLVGTSTMNNVMMPKIAGLVEEMTGLRFRNKRASAFGSHGWSGGAVDRLSTRLQDAGFEMSLSLKAKWRPDLDALELCRQHGRDIARQWALAPLPETTQKTAPVEETTTSAAADLGPKMQCSVCQWIYDPALGEPLQDVAPGTPWNDVPDNFLCPECSLGKDVFDVLATEAK